MVICFNRCFVSGFVDWPRGLVDGGAGQPQQRPPADLPQGGQGPDQRMSGRGNFFNYTVYTYCGKAFSFRLNKFCN